jgi:acylphosphatase
VSGAAEPAAVARRVMVHGHVQGVFFRDSTRREAERRGVAGWAVNRPDGSVELRLEGALEDVDAVIGFCREGPRGARVQRVEVQEIEPEGLRGFQTR